MQQQPIQAPLLNPLSDLDGLVTRAAADGHWRRPVVRIVATGQGFKHRFHDMAALRRREKLEHLRVESITVVIGERRHGDDSIAINASRRVGESEIVVTGRDATWVEGALSLFVRTAERPLTFSERVVAGWTRVVSTASSHPLMVITALASLATVVGLAIAAVKILR